MRTDTFVFTSPSQSAKSTCAFPDVCFTPPQPPAPGGVPVPYPNTLQTAYAPDTFDDIA